MTAHPRLTKPLLLLLSAAGGISACDSCGCHMPSTLDPTTDAGWMEGVFEQYTDFSTLKQDGRKVDNSDHQYMHSSTTQLIIGYHITAWLTVSGFIPYISRSFSRPDSGFTQTGTIQGLGDSTVMASARIFSAENGVSAGSVALLAGVKIPTGSPSELGYELNAPDDADPTSATGGHDLALGSGAFDMIGGFNAVGREGRWFVTTQFTYNYNTEGAYEYRYANELAAAGGIGYFVYSITPWRTSVQMNVSGDSKGLDTVAGQKTDDTENHNVYVGPEANAVWQRKLAMDVALDIPVYEQNSSTQLVPTWRARAAFTYTF